jgi:hypothetical protein
MSDNETPPSAADVAAVFEYAELAVPPDRLAANAELYSSTLALVRRASVAGLGETVPAVGFKAAWD